MLLLQSHTVPIDYSQDQRLDLYLLGVWAALPTRKSIQKALKRGAVRRTGVPLTSAHRAKAGEVYQLWETEERPRVRDYNFRHAVVFEDEYLAVIHKPAGWVVSGNQFKTVQNCLRLTLRASPLPDGLQWPRPVHRLDAATSGLLVIAKARNAHVALGALFAERKMQKTYHAVVQGRLPDGGACYLSLNGKQAHTEYTLLDEVPSLRNGRLSLAEITLHTGRTHQIRQHLATSGFPIVGDRLYGDPENIFRGKGLFLAATGLRLLHPVTSVPLVFQLPVPPKFTSLLQREARRWAKHR